MIEQKGLDMLEPKKEIVAIDIKTFKNKHSGEIVEEKMGEYYEDGTHMCNVFDGREWELINSRKVKFRMGSLNADTTEEDNV